MPFPFSEVLLTHDDPYVLVCAPSNGAADVLAERLDAFADAFLALAAELPPAWWRELPEAGRQLHGLVFRLNSLQRSVQEAKVGILPYCQVGPSLGVTRNGAL